MTRLAVAVDLAMTTAGIRHVDTGGLSGPEAGPNRAATSDAAQAVRYRVGDAATLGKSLFDRRAEVDAAVQPGHGSLVGGRANESKCRGASSVG